MKTYDVIIVGGGITGVSTALHLLHRKIERILIFDPNLKQSESMQCAGFVLGGQRDNLTRVAHAHGEEFAKTLWDFGDQGFLDLKNFTLQNKIKFQQGQRVRLITSEHELEEARKASKLFHKLGFKQVRLDENPDRNLFSDSILAVQYDGEKSAVLDVDGFFKVALQSVSNFLVSANCLKAERVNSHWQIMDSNQNVYRSEFIVVSAHLASAHFVPTIASAYVSAADQWSQHEFSGEGFQKFFAPGSFLSLNHGLEWAGRSSEGECRIGGARFLRHLAGFEATKASYEKKIETFLVKYFEERVRNLKLQQASLNFAGLDCVPCDELPIIGPMFGESQKLLAGGYMGSGLSMGFRAGKCLAEIIATGKSETLPRRLFPERLRSLN